jgi:hypothetical protein
MGFASPDDALEVLCALMAWVNPSHQVHLRKHNRGVNMAAPTHPQGHLDFLDEPRMEKSEESNNMLKIFTP